MLGDREISRLIENAIIARISQLSGSRSRSLLFQNRSRFLQELEEPIRRIRRKLGELGTISEDLLIQEIDREIRAIDRNNRTILDQMKLEARESFRERLRETEEQIRHVTRSGRI